MKLTLLLKIMLNENFYNFQLENAEEDLQIKERKSILE